MHHAIFVKLHKMLCALHTKTVTGCPVWMLSWHNGLKSVMKHCWSVLPYTFPVADHFSLGLSDHFNVPYRYNAVLYKKIKNIIYTLHCFYKFIDTCIISTQVFLQIAYYLSWWHQNHLYFSYLSGFRDFSFSACKTLHSLPSLLYSIDVHA